MRSRTGLVDVVGAAHTVGDDVLDSDVSRGGAHTEDLWKISDKYTWGNAAQPWPMEVFPAHLTRVQGMVEVKMNQCSNLINVALR